MVIWDASLSKKIPFGLSPKIKTYKARNYWQLLHIAFICIKKSPYIPCKAVWNVSECKALARDLSFSSHANDCAILHVPDWEERKSTRNQIAEIDDVVRVHILTCVHGQLCACFTLNCRSSSVLLYCRAIALWPWKLQDDIGLPNACTTVQTIALSLWFITPWWQFR